jgi:hypothetical protein
MSDVTYTFIPCQNDAELLWSQVYTIHARTCLPANYDELQSNVSEGADVRFGETSSMLVALRMLMASSDSCLYRNSV